MATNLPSSIEQTGSQELKLYDLRAIAIATILSSWFAGSFLLSRNLRALGRTDDARNALLFGLLALIPLALIIYSIVVPDDLYQAVGFFVQTAQAGVVHVIASRVHGEQLVAHRESSGEFFSRWRAAGIALLLTPIYVAVMLAIGFAFPNLPGLQE